MKRPKPMTRRPGVSRGRPYNKGGKVGKKS
jgi:hypothetical protein